MRSNLTALTTLSVFACGTFSLFLFAAPVGLTPTGETARHTAELIRLHHETMGLPGSMPAVEQKSDSRTCGQLPQHPALNGAERSMRERVPDTLAMWQAGAI